MGMITCSINGELVEIDESHLEKFETLSETDDEKVIVVGWKLYGVIVQNDVHMHLKKAATFVEATTANLS